MKRIPVTDAMISAEFRRQRLRGSPVKAIYDPLVRHCLVLGAEARAAANVPETEQVDGKARAANNDKD